MTKSEQNSYNSNLTTNERSVDKTTAENPNKSFIQSNSNASITRNKQQFQSFDEFLKKYNSKQENSINCSLKTQIISNEINNSKTQLEFKAFNNNDFKENQVKIDQEKTNEDILKKMKSEKNHSILSNKNINNQEKSDNSDLKIIPNIETNNRKDLLNNKETCDSDAITQRNIKNANIENRDSKYDLPKSIPKNRIEKSIVKYSKPNICLQNNELEFLKKKMQETNEIHPNLNKEQLSNKKSQFEKGKAEQREITEDNQKTNSNLNGEIREMIQQIGLNYSDRIQFQNSLNKYLSPFSSESSISKESNLKKISNTHIQGNNQNDKFELHEEFNSNQLQNLIINEEKIKENENIDLPNNNNNNNNNQQKENEYDKSVNSDKFELQEEV